jgi:type VI secretion system secreted protein VgrG
MADQEHPVFEFTSQALPGDTFSVARFTGEEGLSKLYRFEITVVSKKSDIDLESVLSSPATFKIKREHDDIPFHGILESMDQMQQVGEFTFYRAVLRPKLWWLTLTHHNQIFLNKKLPQFLEQVLTDGGLSKDIDFQLKLTRKYSEWEYVCQYGESHFAFASHWMERDGVYYYFDQSRGTDKAVITDTVMAHSPMPQGDSFEYYQPSGMESEHREEVVHGFICSQRPVPAKVLLRDYNYQRPDLTMEGKAQVSSKGRGELYLYGEHFRSIEEGNALAEVRAQEQLCRQKVIHGESTVPLIRPGYTYNLKHHYRNDLNGGYLTVEARHEGNQEAYLRSGLGVRIEPSSESVYYRNSFTAIPSNVQFRPERVTEKSRFHGSMNAKVDAAGSGKYAELDDQGRYKVILPFDISGRKDGKASCRMRMMQPYTGQDHGMHFPLHKGAEVLLTFIDGDPDRPVISGAVPNPDNPSQITDQDQTMCKLTTAGGNKVHIEDQEGSQRILMHSPSSNTWIRLGAPNDPDDDKENDKDDAGGDNNSDDDPGWKHIDSEEEKSDYGYKLNTDKHIEIKAGSEAKMILGNAFDMVGVSEEKIVAGNHTFLKLGLTEDVEAGAGLKIESGPHSVFSLDKTGLTNETTKLDNNINHIVEQHNNLANNFVHLVNENVELANQTSSIADNVNSLKGSYNSLHGDVNSINENVNTIRGKVDQIIGNSTNMKAQVTKINGEDNTLTATESTITSNKDTITATSNSIKATKNVIEDESTTITAFTVVI